MKMQYNTDHWATSKPIVDDVDWWVQKNLEKEGIEKKIDKLIALVSILTVRHLEQHPEDLDMVADAIGCPYTSHKLIGDNE